MTAEEIREAVSRYTLNIRAEKIGDADVFIAWYTELTGCMVEAPTRDEALRELDFQVVPFAEGMAADLGRLPLPLRARAPRPKTSIQRFHGLVIGDARKLSAIAGGNEPTTSLETPTRVDAGKWAGRVTIAPAVGV